MAHTLEELRALVRTRLGSTADDAMLTDDVLTININNGLINYALEADWPWLQALDTFSVVADTTAYDLPDDFLRFIYLSVNGNAPMDQVQIGELLRLQRLASSTIEPQSYYVVGNSIEVAPVPNTTYTIDFLYQQAEVELEDDDDAILTPNRYADLIVTYAAIDAATVVRDQVLINSLLSMAKDQLRRLERSMQRSQQAPDIQTRRDNYA